MRKALEPYIKLAPFVGIGLVVVVIAVIGILFMQRGAHMELEGSIQKVRTLALEDGSTAAILDFRLQNPSDYVYVVRRVEVSMTAPSGTVLEGMVVSEVDARRLFQYYPALGQKFNDTLVMKTQVKPRTSVDRMLAVRFEAPEKVFASRKELRIRIEELTGLVTEIVQRQQ